MCAIEQSGIDLGTHIVCVYVCVAPKPKSGLRRLVVDVSRSNTFRHRQTDRQTHTHTHTQTHRQQDSSE